VFTEVRRVEDAEQNVLKFVFTKADAVAEAVLYRYPTYKERTVICCSTQSGCPVGCRFCGAGDYFVRSLTSDEIVAQVKHCLDETAVDPAKIGRLQIMFMSMGEPLLNIKNLLPALHKLYALYPNAALLISTSAPYVDYGPILQVSKRIPTIGLQFSVHESTNEARDALIPFKNKLDLQSIATIGEAWYAETRRQPFFNYCAHENNVTDEDARRLYELFDPAIFCATVSVVCERSEGLPATNERQRELAALFADKLVGLGFDVRVFDPAGQDTIGGGCGQLWFVQDWISNHLDIAKPSVGRGLKQVHVPTPEDNKIK
jgi:23S rRNA (adenine2503-C2)-methyltransferase